MPFLHEHDNTTALKISFIFNLMNPSTPLRLLSNSERSRERLDKWLHTQLPAYSRTHLQGWFREGLVRQGDRILKANEEVRAGEHYEVYVPDIVPSALLRGSEMPLDILYEDEALIVVNKAAGIVVHPAPGHTENTLIQGLLHRYPDLRNVGEAERPGLVHRLDAETSGILIFARREDVLQELQRQFKARETEKSYHALVNGMPLKAEGRVDEPLGRHPQDRKRRAVNGLAAREARSAYRVLRGLANGSAALLEVSIETGRTHQIRVHLLHLGHPVLGDKLYGGRRSQLAAPWPQAKRHMLHAFRLRLCHPDDKRELVFEAPLPEDFETCLHTLQQPCP